MRNHSSNTTTEDLRTIAQDMLRMGKHWAQSAQGWLDQRRWDMQEGDSFRTHGFNAADAGSDPPHPTLLDAQDGIPVPAVRSLTLDPVSATHDGRFFIRTPTGFAVLDPRRVVADARPPHPIIEEVTVGGRRVPLDRPISALAIGEKQTAWMRRSHSFPSFAERTSGHQSRPENPELQSAVWYPSNEYESL